MENLIEEKIRDYPQTAQKILLSLHELILKTAKELGQDEPVQSLKWGEVSYASKAGSPIRIDWKEKTPGSVYLFFNCQTRLVETFRELYGDQLVLEGKRALRLSTDEKYDKNILRSCIEMALDYHSLKKLPLLGH